MKGSLGSIRSWSAGFITGSVLAIAGCGTASPPTLDSNVRADDKIGTTESNSDESGFATIKPVIDDAPAAKRPGSDWTCFLGPHGTGISDEKDLLNEWPESGPPVLWVKRIGKGYSAPSILGDRVVVHHRLRDRDLIECVSAQDGARIWMHDYDTNFSDPYGYNNGPRCSPLLTKTRCYTFGAQGRLVCLNFETGEVVWEHATADKWNVPRHFFGAGCTPILEEGLLIVPIGGQPNSGIVAFEAETGKVVWESVGKDTWDGAETDQPGRKFRWSDEEMLVSYSSPIVVTIHGQKHLLCVVRQGLVSLDPNDGKLRFKYWFRSRINDSVNAARPVVVEDQIFLSAAYETGAALLKVHPDNESFDVVWRNRRGMSTHWSTPIYQDGCLYGFSGRHEGEAMLQCVDLKTGDLIWEENGFHGDIKDLRTNNSGDVVDQAGMPVTFFGRGSKIQVDGKYIILCERGMLVLAKLSREKCEQISKVKHPQMHYPTWAAPVLSRGRLFLRSEDYLMCLDVAQPAEK